MYNKEFKSIISPLHGGRPTSQPQSQLTGPPSPPACHSSWSNRTAPSSGQVSDLTNADVHYGTFICDKQSLRVTNVFLEIIIISRTIHQTGDWPLIVRIREKHQLFVDKVIVGEGHGGLAIQVVLWRDQIFSEAQQEAEAHQVRLTNCWRRYLWQVVLPALAPVGHEVGQPLFPLFHFLFTKGLNKNTKSIRYWHFRQFEMHLDY